MKTVKMLCLLNNKLIISCLFILGSWTVAMADVEINETTFPDENFRTWMLSQEYGKDGILTDEEIAGVDEMDVSNENISSLKGIEFFTSLTSLKCVGNQLTVLDVSECTLLMELLCSGNQLTTLDVSSNTALTKLECYDNQLTALNLQNNMALTWLRSGDNQLTELDVSKNKALAWLTCNGNQLTVLDVSKNTALTYLQCMNNMLTTLRVSNLKSLDTLHCFDNLLTTLDVSGCSALTGLQCNNNQLTKLDVSGCEALTSLSCNHNQLTALDLSRASKLTCLSCMQNQIAGKGMDALISSLPTVSEGVWVVMYYQDEQNVLTKSQVASAKAKGWTPQRWEPYILWTDYEGSDDPIAFTAGQMATVCLPREPEADKGKYYRLDRIEDGEIVFEQEALPRAHVPYIIVPNEDFSIEIGSLELKGLTADTVTVEADYGEGSERAVVSFIGSYVSKELSPGGTDEEPYYIELIDTTPDCVSSDKIVIGALRAYLQVGWEDPYHHGGTRVPAEKLQIVLKDKTTGIEGMKNEKFKIKNEADATYDLSGRKLSNGKPDKSSNAQRPQGIYIVGGKKRLAK